MTPSPFSRLATALVSGLVSTAAQSFAGVKTFAALLIASAGIQVSALFNTNGSGASDVCVKVGTSEVDASVNSGAKLLSVRTGVSGTEVEKAYIRKSGSAVLGPFAVGDFSDDGASGTPGLFKFTATSFGIASNGGGVYLLFSTSTGLGSFSHAVASGGVDVSTGTAIMQRNGRIDQRGVDNSGTPGNSTADRPIGKNAIAVGASSVVITNSLVTASSHIVITPHARDATCKELIAVPAAGSFTVSGTANATAALPFSWRVATILA